jgi:hypothetical protein
LQADPDASNDSERVHAWAEAGLLPRIEGGAALASLDRWLDDVVSEARSVFHSEATEDNRVDVAALRRAFFERYVSRDPAPLQLSIDGFVPSEWLLRTWASRVVDPESPAWDLLLDRAGGYHSPSARVRACALERNLDPAAPWLPSVVQILLDDPDEHVRAWAAYRRAALPDEETD